MTREALLVLLDGAEWVNARRLDGRFARIRVPADPARRAALVDAHLAGRRARLTFHAQNCQPWQEDVDRLELAAFCPAADGMARWSGIDLDGPDHGGGGLADPAHAVRVIAERADAAGLPDGLLVARSRGGVGRHLFLVPPEPIALTDGVLAVAALVAQGFQVVGRDVLDYGAAHAFRTDGGEIAKPGQAGAVELIPRGVDRPAFGWALSLPTAERLIDPFTGQPTALHAVPRCGTRHWARFLDDARKLYAARRNVARRDARPLAPREASGPTGGARDLLDRVDGRTRAFLDGQISEGARNAGCFAAACNLLGLGVPEAEAERLILDGARRCGFGEREARTCVASAVGIMRRKGKR